MSSYFSETAEFLILFPSIGVFIAQGFKCGEASQCRNASLHGPGGDVLEHPYVSMDEKM